MKFTGHGRVELAARIATSGWTAGHRVLDAAPVVVAFEVSDTGIGISPEKQRIVFEAFQQADAGTSRKYGGTGLGLAISREIAGLLGGELKLESEVGKGSTFTLYVPLRYEAPQLEESARPSATRRFPAPEAAARAVEAVADDRAMLDASKPTLLVVEDDARYASVIRDLARARGFNVLVTHRGADALRLVREYSPSAISLDIFLPDMLGWTVLARLKQDATTRHIPVQVVTVEEERHHSLERGAFAYIAKPATSELISEALERIRLYTLPRRKKLLVVEDDAGERFGI
jgi:CheY-like chemotaxis protein